MAKSGFPPAARAGHGGVRGADFDQRSSRFEGKFGRIFRHLPPASWPEGALAELAGDGHKDNRISAEPEMDGKRLPTAPREDVDKDDKPRASRLHDDEENSGIDSGYTYLGQFIDHDITFDPASSLQQRNDVDALVDFRTPRLDLDCVYGRGPDDQPYLYHGDERTFQLGEELLEGPGGKAIGRDLPRHFWQDPDGTEHHRALIGDKRNDENVIVSQLHSIFLRFHNAMAGEHASVDFLELQRKVRWHYQYVVLHDFLYKIARPDVIESILPHLASGKSIHDDSPSPRFYKPRNEAFMPIEFAAAAYRFGHSMVRPIYRLNTKLSGGDDPARPSGTETGRGIDGRQFIFAGLKNRGLNGFDAFPREWGIDWNLFFDLTGDSAARMGKDRTQPAYKIDTSLVNPLAFLPEFSLIDSTPPLDDISKLQPLPRMKKVANLALRNLMRGMSMGLPSGQDVALAMGHDPIPDEALKVGKATTAEEYDKLDPLCKIHESFVENAPLWYYVLAEAQYEWRCAGGASDTPTRLGLVGSRIVAETLIGIMLDDGHSLLRQAPAWTPSIGKGAGFDMADFVRFAQGR